VFVSYATADRKQALSVCEAIERRGTKCWISTRDVEPGENYQEAIVRSIRDARAMVLVFSEAANNSDEIKKELSLASRYHVPVMALRIEDVEPSDAFAYELSTRQWIDAFDGWDGSIDALVRKIEQISGGGEGRKEPAEDRSSRASPGFRFSKPIVATVALVALLGLAAAAWMLVRPRPAAAHSMTVRLVGFERLSADLPAGLPDALHDEIIAAFTEDGAVNVSTAAAPPAGTAPAYALSGTVRRDGAQIRVIGKLVDERSGTTLWSNSFKYGSSETARIPRWVAVDVGNIVRCGLFAASTYPKSLPDPVLSDYLQFCQSVAGSEFEPTRALDFAHRIVAAAPDFSWGWAAVENAAVASSYDDPTSPRAAALRKEGLAAFEKAISLDPSNSDALEAKSYLIDRNDLVGRDDLLERAVAARQIATWSEHASYANLLEEVGRNRDAIEEYRRSLDVLALNANTQGWLGAALLRRGETKEAKAHFDAAADLSTSAATQNSWARLFAAVAQSDYAAALKSLDEADDSLPATETTAAYRIGFRALMTHSPQDRLDAIKALASLSILHMGPTGILLLGSLGANAEAMRYVEEGTRERNVFWRSLLFYPSLAGARTDPRFPAVAERLGLMRYWKTTHTRPDVCSDKDPPPFCRMI